MYAHGVAAVLICATLPPAAHAELWKTEIDNTLVRVLRCSIESQGTVSVSDSSPSLFVFLADYPVRISTPERQTATQGRRDSFWYAGGAITLANPGAQRIEIVRVIPKFHTALSYQLESLANPSVVEFENELMRVRRIGPPSPTANGVGRPHNPSSSVMIELTSAIHARFRHASGRLEEVRHQAGDIWYQPEDPFVPEMIERGPNHQALRIELKSGEAKP